MMSKNKSTSNLSAEEKVERERLKEEAAAKVKAEAEALAEEKSAEQQRLKDEAAAKAEYEALQKKQAKEDEIAAKKAAKKHAQEAVAKAKKARVEADKAEAEATKALDAVKEKQVLRIVMESDISLTVSVPGHSKVNIIKKFVVGEEVTRLAFIRQIMGSANVKYKILEEG